MKTPTASIYISIYTEYFTFKFFPCFSISKPLLRSAVPFDCFISVTQRFCAVQFLALNLNCFHLPTPYKDLPKPRAARFPLRFPANIPLP